MDLVTCDEFYGIDLRVGTVIDAQPFKEARKPAYILKIDFGPERGVLRSSAQITDLYPAGDLIGRQIIAVTNLPPKQVGPIMSECLVTGFRREDGKVVLAVPDSLAPNGVKLE